MINTYEFKVKSHKVKIVNTWLRGVKLYVNGDFRDHDGTFFANGKTPLLSANLEEVGILEVYPKSNLFSVSMEAFLIASDEELHVYSSK